MAVLFRRNNHAFRELKPRRTYLMAILLLTAPEEKDYKMISTHMADATVSCITLVSWESDTFLLDPICQFPAFRMRLTSFRENLNSLRL